MNKTTVEEPRISYPQNLLMVVFGMHGRPSVSITLTEEELQRVDAALAVLSDAQREVLRLKFRDEMTDENIAAYFEVSLDTVRAQVAMTLRHLRHPSCSKKLRDIAVRMSGE